MSDQETTRIYLAPETAGGFKEAEAVVREKTDGIRAARELLGQTKIYIDSDSQSQDDKNNLP